MIAATDRPYVWRYNPLTTDRPWIVSMRGHDSQSFPTWDEAMTVANTMVSENVSKQR